MTVQNFRMDKDIIHKEQRQMTASEKTPATCNAQRGLVSLRQGPPANVWAKLKLSK